MLTIDDARTLITTSLTDLALFDAIAREEAWLASRIGPLSGERIETFVPQTGGEVLELRRRTLAATVEDDTGDVADFTIRGWSDILRTAGAWAGVVLVAYEPDDGPEVRRALITLVRLSINESAYVSQGAAGYAATIDPHEARAARWAAWRSLLRRRGPTTLRLRSTVQSDTQSIHAVGVEEE